MAKTVKSRYWSVIAWVESVDKDFIKRLKDINQVAVVSPLHDRDIDDETGELKKSHYHILLCYDGPTTLESVQSLCNEFQFGLYVEKVRSVRNLLDYLTHDSYSSSGKYHYSVDDIQFINCELRDFVNNDYIKVIEFIVNNQISSFHGLCKMLLEKTDYNLLEYVSKNSYFVNTFICSLKNELKDNVARDVKFIQSVLVDLEDSFKLTLEKETYDRLIELLGKYDVVSEGKE